MIDTATLTTAPKVTAPDGSTVRILSQCRHGSGAHFTLAPGATSIAVRHRTVEEIWFIVSGQGRMWQSVEGCEDFVELAPDLCLTIPTGAAFQFRNDGDEPLCAYAVTMPPWPGEDEAVFVDGTWPATVSAAPGI